MVASKRVTDHYVSQALQTRVSFIPKRNFVHAVRSPRPPNGVNLVYRECFWVFHVVARRDGSLTLEDFEVKLPAPGLGIASQFQPSCRPSPGCQTLQADFKDLSSGLERFSLLIGLDKVASRCSG